MALSSSTLNSSNSSPSDSDEYLEVEYFEDVDDEKVDDADVVEDIEDAKIRFSLSSSNGDEDIVGRGGTVAAMFSSLITLFLGMDLGTLEEERGKEEYVEEEEEVVVDVIEEEEDEDVDVVKEMAVETEETEEKEESFESTFSETDETGWVSKVGLEGFRVDEEEVSEVCLRAFTGCENPRVTVAGRVADVVVVVFGFLIDLSGKRDTRVLPWRLLARSTTSAFSFSESFVLPSFGKLE